MDFTLPLIFSSVLSILCFFAFGMSLNVEQREEFDKEGEADDLVHMLNLGQKLFAIICFFSFIAFLVFGVLAILQAIIL